MRFLSGSIKDGSWLYERFLPFPEGARLQWVNIMPIYKLHVQNTYHLL